MFKRKISFQLVSGFILIVLISMFIIGTIFIQMFKEYTFEYKENDMFNRAHNIAEIVSQNAISTKGTGGLNKILDIMADAKVWITNDAGEPYAMSSGNSNGMGNGKGFRNKNTDSNENEASNRYISEEIPESLKGLINELLEGKDEISYQGYNTYYEEESLIVGVSIKDSNSNIIGTVLVMAQVEGISENINKAMKILALGLLIGLIVSIILGSTYSLKFTKPLRKMNKTANLMKNGNFNVRTGINKKDEIGQLGESIDALAEKLKTTIDELYQEKRKLENIILSISDGLVAFDLDLNPISSNNSLAIIMGQKQPYENEMIINDFNDMNLLDDIKSNKEKTKSITKSWNDKILKITISNIIDNKSNISGYVALLQDISQSERLEQLRKDFVANVSHEFRTPITVIKASLEALLDGVIEEKNEVLNYYKRMISETKGLERLVRDLLELSKLQSGKISIKKESIHIINLIKDTLRSLRTIADKKNIQIVEEYDNNINEMNGDYDRIKQLIVIFVDNAVKYSPDNTVISIKLELKEKLEIIIKDEGYGIKEEEIPYIFDRFYKSDKSRKFKGTGLGLSIAKYIIELHEGNVSVESKLGKGTVVSIYLPVY